MEIETTSELPAWLVKGAEAGADKRVEISREKHRPVHFRGVDARIAATVIPKSKRRKQKRSRQ